MIVSAAVKVGDKIYKGNRHGGAITAAMQNFEVPPITQKMQGFVLDTGEFVTRIQARPIAIRCGQLLFNKAKVGKPLISEELW